MSVRIQVWTQTLTDETIVIDSNYDFVVLSIYCNSGTVTITGALFAGERQSNPIVLSKGQGLSIDSGTNQTNLLTNLTIQAEGTTFLIGR
jgi:hypothetical protein